MSMEIESIVKNLPTKKSLGLGGFTGEFYHTFEEEFMPFKTFPEIERKGIITLWDKHYPATKVR